ncbi:MAG: hypothetical protein ACE5HD_00540 [Acidobacteriota bacterium]
MPATTPLYLLLTAIAGGLVASLALVPARQTSRGFARTLALVAVGAWVPALAYDAWFRLGPRPRPGLAGGAGMLAVACQGAALGLALLYLRRLGRERLPGRGLMGLAAGCSGIGLGIAPVLILGATARGILVMLGALQGLVSAAVLGAGLSAMLLGHFYLVVPGLSLDPLRRLTRLFAAAVLLHLLLDGVVLSLVGPGAVLPRSGGMDPVLGLLVGLVPLLMRVLFGLVGALLLAIMALQTVAMRSTRSATGILYAAVVFVLIGEFAAGHLLVSLGLPL